jgi:hypothetical protein
MRLPGFLQNDDTTNARRVPVAQWHHDWHLRSFEKLMHVYDWLIPAGVETADDALLIH